MLESAGTYTLYFLAAFIGSNIALYALAALTQLSAVTFAARSLASYATLVLCAIYGVLASLFLRVFGNYRITQWTTARSFYHSMWWTTGVRFTIVSGEEHLHQRPVVIVGNHQSALDILLLAAIWPRYCSVTAKKSLKRAPFLGWFMALSGTVFINRTDRDSAIKAFADAAEEIRTERQSVFIFPEGTRHAGQEAKLGEFKKGAFHMAVQAQVPIVPVVSANYWGLLSIPERRFRAGRIPVMVLPPIPTKGLTTADVDRLATQTRDSMLRALIELTDTPMGRNAISAREPYPGIVTNEAVAVGGMVTNGKKSQ